MSFNVAMLEAMQAEGLDLEACIRILSAGEKRADPTAAERQQRRRNKIKAERDESRRDVTRDGVSNDIDNSNLPQPPTATKVASGGKRATKTKFVLPERIPPEPWAGFEEMRLRIGKPMTDRARQLAVAELDKLAEAGWPPGEVLNHCTMNSYQGIYPPKAQQNGRQTNSIRGTRPSPALDMWLDAQRDLEAERTDTPPDFGTRAALPAIRPS